MRLWCEGNIHVIQVVVFTGCSYDVFNVVCGFMCYEFVYKLYYLWWIIENYAFTRVSYRLKMISEYILATKIWIISYDGDAHSLSNPL